jgi:hypothetical protein
MIHGFTFIKSMNYANFKGNDVNVLAVSYAILMFTI